MRQKRSQGCSPTAEAGEGEDIQEKMQSDRFGCVKVDLLITCFPRAGKYQGLLLRVK